MNTFYLWVAPKFLSIEYVLIIIFDDQGLSPIQADSMYTRRIVDNPAFQMYTHKWSTFLAADKCMDLGLKKVATAVKN